MQRNGQPILVVVEQLSKFVIARLLAAQTAAELKTGLLSAITSLVPDGGTTVCLKSSYISGGECSNVKTTFSCKLATAPNTGTGTAALLCKITAPTSPGFF